MPHKEREREMFWEALQRGRKKKMQKIERGSSTRDLLVHYYLLPIHGRKVDDGTATPSSKCQRSPPPLTYQVV